MPVPHKGTLLERFQEFIYENYGIHYHQQKTDILRMKLDKLLESQQCSAEEFYQSLVLGSLKARDQLLEAITVGHTFFFREQQHLDILLAHIQKTGNTRPLIWCAASSTGEEPYSIAIKLLMSGINTFVVVASDINKTVLDAMNRGVYPPGKFEYTPKHIKTMYFTRHGPHSFKISPEVRKHINIKRLNLQEELLFERPFDYIFCRNVMIYFDEPGRKKVVKNVSRNLANGGLLFVGHTEAILEVQKDLEKYAPAVFRKV